MPQQPRRKSGGGGKLIGCGLAGCFGVIIAIGLILGVVFVVADSASSSTPSGASPKSGPLRDIIPKKVGKWKATGSKPLQVEGAVDSLLVKYRAGSSTLEYAVAIFPSDSMAKGALEGASDVVRRDTGETGEPIRIKDPGGKVIGTGYHFRTNPEIICYEIGKLMAVTSGPPGEVADFVAKL